MMTPLLYCANRGLTEMVKLLLTLGADRSHTDRNVRPHVTCLSSAMMKFFVHVHSSAAQSFMLCSPEKLRSLNFSSK